MEPPPIVGYASAEEVGVLGVLVDELGHVPALRDDPAAAGVYVVEGATDQFRAETMVAHRGLDLRVREDDGVAVGSIVGDAGETAVEVDLVPRACPL